MRLSVNLDLLDNQVTDANRLPIGRVDDLEVDLPEDGSGAEPEITGVVVSAEALGHRIGGRVGAAMSSVPARLRDVVASGPPVVDIELVEQARPFLVLTEELPALPEVAGLEHWLRQHVVAPGEAAPGRGGGHASQ